MVNARGSIHGIAAIAIGATGLLGCVNEARVVRVENGRVEVGAPVDPSAYAASLRDSIERAQARADSILKVPRRYRSSLPISNHDRSQINSFLAQGDTSEARKLARHVGMEDAELSLRAWYFGQVEFAQALAHGRLAAEPAWAERELNVGTLKLLRPHAKVGDAALAWLLALHGENAAAQEVMKRIGSAEAESAPVDAVLVWLLAEAKRASGSN